MEQSQEVLEARDRQRRRRQRTTRQLGGAAG